MYKLVLLGCAVLSICLSIEAQEIKINNWMTMKGHTLDFKDPMSNFNCLSISPDGKLVASGARGEVRIWSIEKGKSIYTLSHPDIIRSVCFSPDGKILASAGEDTVIRVWSVEEGRLLNELKKHSSTIYCLSFSPDGKLLVSSSSKIVRLWDVESGNEFKSFESLGYSSAVCFSPNGQFLAISNKNEIEIKSVPEGLPVKSLSGHKACIYTIGFSRDGKLLASSGQDMSIKIWSVETGEELNTIMAGNMPWFSPLSFDPTNNWIGASGIRIFSTITGKAQAEVVGSTCLSFSPDWKFMVTRDVKFEKYGPRMEDCRNIGILKFFSLTYKKPAVNVTAEDIKKSPNKTPTRFQISSAGSLPDYTKMAEMFRQRFGTDPKKMNVTEKFSSKGDINITVALAFSSDGKLLATGGFDKAVRLWSTTDGAEIRTFEGHLARINGVCFTTDSKFLISSSEDNTIKIWNIETGNIEANLTPHAYSLTRIALSQDGSLLASGGDDNVVVYDMKKGEIIKTLDASKSTKTGLSFSPGDKLLAAVDAGGNICIWSMPEGTEKIKWKDVFCTDSVAFSHDGKLLACGGSKGKLKIWSVEKGECVQTIDIPSGYIFSHVEFSPDDNLLMFICGDIFLASVKTGEKVILIKQNRTNYNTIENICVSPDWRYIAGGRSKRITIWALRGESGGGGVSSFGKESDLHPPSEPVRRGGANEAEAKSLLSLAKNFKLNKLDKLAIEKLNEIIKKYPDSEYADEARKLLKELKK